MKKHSKKHHKSHHIFIYLGGLLFIFIIFLGTQYFESEYSFENILGSENAQTYDSGKLTGNPFTLKENITANTYNWKKFGSQKITFAYPGKYALQIISGNYIRIIPPVSSNSLIDCGGDLDEQEYSKCVNPDMSPDITIELKNDSEINPFNSSDNLQKIDINGDVWQRTSYQDEYGGEVQYRHTIDTRILQVSYKFTDTLGGISFDTLHKNRGDQYQLSAVDQNKLVMNILTTIEIK